VLAPATRRKPKDSTSVTRAMITAVAAAAWMSALVNASW
jgi:hypothetical protein